MPNVWIPGSNEPFRPINPWGRSIPKVKQRSRPQLWQVIVTWNGREVPVGPKAERSLIDDFYAVIVKGIRCGAEKEWSNPRVEKAVAKEQPQGQKTLGDLLKESVHAA